jgi:molybdate transport system substrate-binding protein
VVACFTQAAPAADITFLCANALESAMKELIPELQKAGSHVVTISYSNVGANADKVRKGEAADLAIVAPAQVEALARDNKIAAAPRIVIGKVGIGVLLKKGTPKPDVGSVDILKSALTKASSIAVGDPAQG